MSAGVLGQLRRVLAPFPRVRDYLRYVYFAGRDVQYIGWRAAALLRRGPVQLRIHGDDIFVRLEDWRAFRIARGRAPRDKPVVKTWLQLVQLGADVALDVGANYGQFTAAAAGSGPRIIAVEPNPWVAECLARTFAQSPDVVVERCALSAENGTAQFHFNRTYSGEGSLDERVITLASASEQLPYVSRKVESAQVTLTTLPALIERHAGRVESLVIKLDIEGHEPAVLRVSHDFLGRLRWWRALVEYNPVALRRCGEDPGEVWRFLTSFDYVSLCGADRVPASPPEICDLLIGAGTPSARPATVV
jgi:FkbM family methyltransferase